MARPLRLLTTDRAPGYLRSLAALDARWDVRVADPGDLGAWWARLRELPAGVRAVRPDRAADQQRRGAYDAIIAHGVSEALAWAGGPAPVITVWHERRELAEAYGDGPAAWTDEARAACAGQTHVFASPEAARSWAATGPVIVPAVDPGAWALSDMSAAEAVTVSPFTVERAAFDTAWLLARLAPAAPLAVLGTNPGLGIDSDTATLPARRRAFSTRRVYVHLGNPAFDLAAPTPMLEAMASGLPVVTLAHADTPVVDGVSGFVCADADALVAMTRRLVDDVTLATRMGTAARRAVFERYGIEAFTTQWRALLAETIARRVVAA